MNDDQTLSVLARSNPLPEAPEYDDVAEAALAELLAVTNLETPPARVRGRRRAKQALVGALVAVPAAAVVAVLGIGGSESRVDGPRRQAAKVGSARPDVVLTAKLVADRTGQALASAGGYIVQATQTTTGPAGTFKSVTWTDEGVHQNFRDREYDQRGDLALDSAHYRSGGRFVFLQIDYAAHAYTLISGTDDPKPVSKAGKPTATSRPPAGNDATNIAESLRHGTDRLLGRASLDGRPVLKLANREPGMHRVIWVDPDSYLPVRMTAHGGWGSYQIDYTWIERTAESLARSFRPAIPAGFAKVDPPPKG